MDSTLLRSSAAAGSGTSRHTHHRIYQHMTVVLLLKLRNGGSGGAQVETGSGLTASTATPVSFRGTAAGPTCGS